MAKKQPFNRIERKLQQIPTSVFVGVCVVGLIFVAFWIQPEENLDSFRDIVRVAFYNADAIAIAAAVALYFKEIPDRKESKHHEAWKVIDNALGVETSYARYKALQILNQDGVPLAGIDLPGADLRNINLQYANLSRANLQKADLCGANLSGANLSQANLSQSRLEGADLSGTNLAEADLSGANLHDTYLNRADLSYANLIDSQVHDGALGQVKLYNTKLPKGSKFNSSLSNIGYD